MGTNEPSIPDKGSLECTAPAQAAATADLLAAMQLEIEKLREERDLYLEALYQATRANRTEEPLPSFEELKRTSKPIKLDF